MNIIREELENSNITTQDFKNCRLVNFDKAYKQDKDGSNNVKIKRELECDYMPVPKQVKDTDRLKSIDKLEDKYTDNGNTSRVSISKSVFDKYLKWLDSKSPSKATVPEDDITTEESDLERKTRVMGEPWANMMRLSKGIY